MEKVSHQSRSSQQTTSRRSPSIRPRSDSYYSVDSIASTAPLLTDISIVGGHVPSAIDTNTKAFDFYRQFHEGNCRNDLPIRIKDCNAKVLFIEQLISAIKTAQEFEGHPTLLTSLSEMWRKQTPYDIVLASHCEVQAPRDRAPRPGENLHISYATALLFKTKAQCYLSAEQELKNKEEVDKALELTKSIIAFIEKLQLLTENKEVPCSEDEQKNIYFELCDLNAQVNAYEQSVKKDALPSPLVQHIESRKFEEIVFYCTSAIATTWAFLIGAQILAVSIALMATIPYLLTLTGNLVKLTTAYFEKKKQERALAAEPIRRQILLPLANSLKTIMSTINISERLSRLIEHQTKQTDTAVQLAIETNRKVELLLEEREDQKQILALLLEEREERRAAARAAAEAASRGT